LQPTAVEDALKEKGGLYERGATWQSFCVEDGRLITGQNPASSEAVAHALMKQLGV
jgi:putative intracellular protease/amidase